VARIDGHHQTLLADLPHRNPDALLLEPRSRLDKAVVALSNTPDDHWREVRPEGTWVAVYKGESLVQILMAQGVTYSQAIEWVATEMESAWVGPGTWVVEWDPADA
tara:strand:+ start:152 stop:469 length:318 start_codon:yes stop_codon:yes gene_type:complete